MIRILFYSPESDPGHWQGAFEQAAQDAGQEIIFYNHPDWPSMPYDDPVFACVWKPPAGLFDDLPHLDGIFSLGAGAEHLVPMNLPHVPIIRLGDLDLREDMADYITMSVMMLHRDMPCYIRQQKERDFAPHFYAKTGDITVGFLGLGRLNARAAEKVRSLGYRTISWSRSAKENPPTHIHVTGQDGVKTLQTQADIIAAVLPHTPETDGLLDKDFFDRCKPGVKIINAGRGSLIKDQDLIDALDSGQVDSAILDVFREEPLPKDHPYWTHANIVITPHTASVTRPASAAIFIMDGVKHILDGQTLPTELDKKRGY